MGFIWMCQSNTSTISYYDIGGSEKRPSSSSSGMQTGYY